MKHRVETELAAHFLDVAFKHHGLEGLERIGEADVRQSYRDRGSFPLDEEDELADNEPDSDEDPVNLGIGGEPDRDFDTFFDDSEEWP